MSSVFAVADIPGGAVPVPEPTTMLLLGTGLVGLTRVAHRKTARRA